MEAKKYIKTGFIRFEHILLDRDYNDYQFQNPLPVVFSMNTKLKVGLATLKKSGRSLYCDLMLDTAGDYDRFYALAPFTIYGKIDTIILSATPLQDPGMNTLGRQVEKTQRLHNLEESYSK